MDRETAQRNLRRGLLAWSIALGVFALTFFATILYIG